MKTQSEQTALKGIRSRCHSHARLGITDVVAVMSMHSIPLLGMHDFFDMYGICDNYRTSDVSEWLGY